MADNTPAAPARVGAAGPTPLSLPGQRVAGSSCPRAHLSDTCVPEAALAGVCLWEAGTVESEDRVLNGTTGQQERPWGTQVKASAARPAQARSPEQMWCLPRAPAASCTSSPAGSGLSSTDRGLWVALPDRQTRWPCYLPFCAFLLPAPAFLLYSSVRIWLKTEAGQRWLAQRTPGILAHR